MIRRIRPFLRITILTVVSLWALASLSCIFDSEPSVPAYPAEIDAEIAFGSIGSPSICKCMIDYDIALVAAGTSLAVIDIVNGKNESVFDLGLEIDDIADSDVNGFGYVLTDSLLYPVKLSGAVLENPINIGTGCSFVSVSSGSDAGWVSMDNDSIAMLDLATGKVSVVQDYAVKDCQGIALADNGALYIADGSNNLIIGYNTDTWAEIGRVTVPGDVHDLFPGPSGYICAIVDGSNELWFIKSETCTLYKMITFPAIPTAAAAMPDGSFAYAACPGTGMVIVAESGQIELKTMDFGLPSGIDVSNDGQRAVICAPDKEAVYVLVR
ncbi:MAG: hypothetical protein GQ565_04180 [Candidatus Aegiribacteria sp.]|nr:hypothetical protein [Candidatus Aegiribacteria sp.]